LEKRGSFIISMVKGQIKCSGISLWMLGIVVWCRSMFCDLAIGIQQRKSALWLFCKIVLWNGDAEY
jgi:hypothetical protein